LEIEEVASIIGGRAHARVPSYWNLLWLGISNCVARQRVACHYLYINRASTQSKIYRRSYLQSLHQPGQTA